MMPTYESILIRCYICPVPVSTHVTTPYSSLKAGTELRIQCDVDGYPDPDVYWTKDGARITPDDRISISGKCLK